MNYRSLHKEFRSLGSTNDVQTTAACQLFIELIEIRKKSNIKYFYNGDLNLVYLAAYNGSGSIECFYIANPSSATLDLTLTETIRSKLIETHALECPDADKVQLMLAIVDPNTTIVYYKLTLGLIDLDILKMERSQQKTCEKDNTYDYQSRNNESI